MSVGRISEGGGQFHVTPSRQRDERGIEGDQAHTAATRERQQVRIGHLAVAHY
ncbi:MAG: hypothetical protein ACRDRP_06760 [Pseudonocardiaceae bacterium]